MSLGKTLLKVAIGVAIVKGVTSLTKGSAAPEVDRAGSPGRGTRYDGGRDDGPSGRLEDILGEALGGGGRTAPESRTRETAAQRRGAGQGRPEDESEGGFGGGLGDLLEELAGPRRTAPRKSAPKGGLDDLLGELTGSRDSRDAPSRSDPAGGVGDLLDMVLRDKRGGGPVTLPEPKREEELSAALMLRAVIQAVKCDGALDEDERARLVKAMGDADQREVQAVQAELNRPVDVAGLARSVPAGLEPKVYLASLMAIDLDQKAEADYLHRLAEALELAPREVNALHDKLGAPRLYR